MKVSTEACILGAYSYAENPTNILDIGTGTGLLALMLAQRFPDAQITALEIEANAFAEARENVEKSKFARNIEVLPIAVQTFANTTRKFDLIVSNPPFYEKHLLSADTAQNIALHQETLSLKELAECLQKLLAPAGLAYVLLPPYQMQQFTTIAHSYSLFPKKRLAVHHSSQHKLFRCIVGFGFEQGKVSDETLYIKEANDSYSESFRNLLKDFYLAF